MWIVCTSAHKIFVLQTLFTLDPSLSNRLMPIKIIKMLLSCENRKITKLNTAYVYNITKIQIVQFILWPNTGYLRIGSLDPPEI
jgi:uncharacterized membrane protein